MGAVPVVVVGDTLAEVVVPAAACGAYGSPPDPRDVRCRPAGAGAVTAAWLSWLHTPTTLVGRVGDDPLGHAVTAGLTARGVAVRLQVVPGAPTGTVVVLGPPSGPAARVDEPGAAAMLGPDDLPADVFAPGRHLHLAGQALISPSGSGVGAAAIARARAAGMTVSAQPPPAPALQALDPQTARAALSGVDLLLASPAEAFAMVEDALEEEGGDWHPARCAAVLARTVAEVVITGGPAGSWWHGRRGAPVHVMAHPVADRGPAAAIDPFTDDGDQDEVRPAFVAGFLAAWLLGAAPAQALRSGSRLADQAQAGTDPLPGEGGGAKVRS